MNSSVQFVTAHGLVSVAKTQKNKKMQFCHKYLMHKPINTTRIERVTAYNSTTATPVQTHNSHKNSEQTQTIFP